MRRRAAGPSGGGRLAWTAPPRGAGRQGTRTPERARGAAIGHRRTEMTGRESGMAIERAQPNCGISARDAAPKRGRAAARRTGADPGPAKQPAGGPHAAGRASGAKLGGVR